VASQQILGQSPAVTKLKRMITKVASREKAVLILGESGTGKELVARAIHESGPRAAKHFLAIDCGALAATVVESELFGHVKGAFTGADRDKQGLFEAAGAGTVFLDEIAELSLELQAKLLRALQEKEVRPVGSTKGRPFSARVIAATNRGLELEVKEKRFRQDLYYRLAVVVMKVPSLRERRDDIPLLVEHFLENSAGNGFDCTVTPDAMQLLIAYDWPGNIRELENCIERAVALNTTGPVRKEDLPTQIQSGRGKAAAAAMSGVSMEELERRAIEHALADTNNNKIAAAKRLGIGKTTLYRKLKEYAKAED
jgi:transcriptional regulator with PAS, ATPase and Fis domain